MRHFFIKMYQRNMINIRLFSGNVQASYPYEMNVAVFECSALESTLNWLSETCPSLEPLGKRFHCWWFIGSSQELQSSNSPCGYANKGKFYACLKGIWSQADCSESTDRSLLHTCGHKVNCYQARRFFHRKKGYHWVGPLIPVPSGQIRDTSLRWNL